LKKRKFNPDEWDFSEDAKWLIALDKEVRKVETYWDRQFNRDAVRETFHDERKLTVKELKKLLAMVKDEKTYTFTPENGCMGFRIVYNVCAVKRDAPGVPFDIAHIFRVSEKQLPTGWDWDQLQPHFTSAAQLKVYKMEPIRDRAHYEY